MTKRKGRIPPQRKTTKPSGNHVTGVTAQRRHATETTAAAGREARAAVMSRLGHTRLFCVLYRLQAPYSSICRDVPAVMTVLIPDRRAMLSTPATKFAKNVNLAGSLLHEVELSACYDGSCQRHLRRIGEFRDHGHVTLRLLVLGCGRGGGRGGTAGTSHNSFVIVVVGCRLRNKHIRTKYVWF